MTFWRTACALWLAATAAGVCNAATVTQWVDPFIGTAGTGHTFPGASVPFGMVAPSPDTGDRGWDHSSGYQFHAPKILGFSNTHMSGTGIGELGDVLLMPAQGQTWTKATTDFAAAPNKSSETARVGYYRVALPNHRVSVELTASQRVAWHRYTFARSGTAQVLVDLQHGILFNPDSPRVTDAGVETDATKGEIVGTLHSKQWVERQASFIVRFSEAPERVETLPARPGERAPRYLLHFKLKTRVLTARVALSTVDVDGARRNLDADPTSSFAGVQTAAEKQWNSLLSRVEIDAPATQKRLFYTALYHVFLHPSDIADADGRVRGPTGKVRVARLGQWYSTLSLWDTFRAVHPLFTVLVPERVDAMVQTLLDHQEDMGYLPLWTVWGRETWTMIGNPALPVIADAVEKGFTGFDHKSALAAMVETSQAPRPHAPAWAQRDWMPYLKYGYVPFDLVAGEAVSTTLEYGVGDDAVARVARKLGAENVANNFAERALGYRLLWDSETTTMRARDTQERWRTPFDPLRPTSPLQNPGDYTEANAWQYTLTPALHDPQGLIATMGDSMANPAAFESWLDRFFSLKGEGENKHLGQEAMIGQYAHGNEPNHHSAWLYAFTASPWKGHQLIRRISNSFYRTRPDGIIGNDDCGQMSAWYVFATLGFYPVQASAAQFVTAAPQVASARLHLAGGKTLRVHAENFHTKRPWARSVALNGNTVKPTALPWADLMAGGELRFVMQALPQR